MGCVASRIDKEERVRNFRERKRLMKELVVHRGEFADAQLAYLRELKNTGITLKQFTESDSLDLEIETTKSLSLQLRPPRLPPAPPSPSLYIRDRTKEVEEINQNASADPLPQTQSSSWPWSDIDPFRSPLPYEQLQQIEKVVQTEEEKWAEATTEFEEDDEEDEVPAKSLANSSKFTLDGIIKVLDDYFLKASACGKEIAVLMDFDRGDTYLPQNLKENKRKRSSSAKVFSALSWSWSFKSLQSSQGAIDLCGSTEPCKPEAHCITLKKLYAAEQKLYKEVKKEEMAKLERERKSMLLQKLIEENQNQHKIEKTQSCVDILESDIEDLQFSIKESCSYILELINDKLYPQLVAIISGLMQLWRTMYECHQAQHHICRRLNCVNDIQNMDFTTDNHHQATVQLVTEVTYWYHSFCELTKSQRDYVKSLGRWIHLSNCLVDENQQSLHCSSAIHKLCEDWQLAFDKLPEKVASEAIKNFLSDIQAIFQQQIEELNLQKRKERLERRLQKELNTLAEMERRLEKELNSLIEREERFEGSYSTVELTQSDLSPKHPVSLKRSKIQALEERVEAERTRYLNSVKVTKTMTLNNLKTSLPSVFQALLEFSEASARAFQAVVYNHIKRTAPSSNEVENSTT